MSQTLFCFGLGYSARALARRLRVKGWRIQGTCRDPLADAARTEDDFELFRFAGGEGDPAIAGALEQATHVLVSVPPDAAGDPVLARFESALTAAAALRWIGYLSTTGVYGNRDGGWVDEASALRPSSPRSERRAAAEAAWLALGRDNDVAVQVFRLAGIYGPGRNQLRVVRAGEARRIQRPGQVFSRIHVADIATVLEASIARPNPGAVYNVCDEEAAEPAVVTAYACALLGLEPPPPVAFEDAALSPMARSFWLDNKRVSNRRIKEELGVAFAYPTYREGLRALFEAGE